MSKPLRGLLAAPLIVLALGACDRIDQDVHEAAQASRDAMSAAAQEVERTEQALARFQSPQDAGGCMTSGQAASFRRDLSAVNAVVSEAIVIETDRLAPLLDDNDGDRQARALELIAALDRKTASVRRLRADLQRRISATRTVRQDPDVYRDRIVARSDDLRTSGRAAERLVAQARADHPRRAATAAGSDPFAGRAEIVFLTAAARTADRLADRALANIEAAATQATWNCVTIADAHVTIADLHEQAEGKLQTARADFAALNRHETRILIDQKAVYTVQIGRSSWDYSGGRDVNRLFEPVTVPADTYEYVVNLPEDERLAFKDRYWEDVRPNIPEQHWRHLRPENPFVDWPHDDHHDEASFWVQDWDWNHFHKYRVVTEQGSEITDWISVDASKYDTYKDALGMEIASKPIGKFADEAYTTPAPPGMSLVGNSRYGEWRTEDGEPVAPEALAETDQAGSGSSPLLWYFLGRWSALNNLPGGDYRYTHAGYRDYAANYRGREAYHGRPGPEGKRPFGSRGTLTTKSPAYRTSTFARTGGFQAHAVPPSIRGAGPAGRGGGPGGGGK